MSALDFKTGKEEGAARDDAARSKNVMVILQAASTKVSKRVSTLVEAVAPGTWVIQNLYG